MLPKLGKFNEYVWFIISNHKEIYILDRIPMTL